MGDNMLLVLSVIEGSYFPKRPHHHLLIEANFDSEVLTTDTTKHIDCPKFNTELAWEIDKKSLHQHRLQRTPIKVQMFAIESSSMRKEMVGYCILDLRTAQSNENKKASWFNLLNSKYHNLKPRVKLALSIEDDQMKENLENKNNAKTKNINKKNVKSQQQKQQQQLSPPLPQEPSSPESMNVVLDDDQGYYLIGPESSNCETFVMSVSINGIKDLINLLPSTSAVEAENGFYFYYSLLDNDVTNETFYELTVPNIPVERASVRIHTTPDRLDNYLKRKKNLHIYLCSGDTTLGETTIPLDGLIEKSHKLPRSITGMFPLQANFNKSSPSAHVGVSIVLQRDRPEVDTSPMKEYLQPHGTRAAKEDFNPALSPVKDDLVRLQMNRTPSPKMTTPPTKLDHDDHVRLNEKAPKHSSTKPQKSPQKSEKNHHFVFSIDLRSIGNMDIGNPVHCYCRYSYPFFGSSAPVLTNPPVYLQRHCEVVLPQSFCQFEFAASHETLQATLSRVPLIIEIWSKDVHQKDALIGIAQIHLSNVFFAENKRKIGPQVSSEKVPIVSGERPGSRIGTLHVVIGFQDDGELNMKFPARRKITQQSFSTDDSYVSKGVPEENSKPPGRSAQEYQVAMALELWRQQQEEHFKSQLKLKEQERMRSLAEEWKQRDLEREMLLKRKLQEFSSLESNLKTSLTELEDRQKRVSEQEMLLEKNQVRLAEEYDRKMVELREASRRLKEEYQHQLQLEKNKQKDTDERFQRLSFQYKDLEMKLKERDEEIFSLKQCLLERPEVKMQSDMNLLLVEKNELERKIDAITKSKIHYKQQWGRALRELARMKMNDQEEARSRLKKQQQELDHMKLRYLAAEEKQVIQSEKEELNQIKDELSKRLDDMQSNIQKPVKDSDKQDAFSGDQDELISYVGSDRVAKLIEERDTLLQTGVYTTDDPVISELDREIRQLIAQKS